MAVEEKKHRLDFGPPTTRSDAEYTRHVSKLSGAKTAFGRAVLTLMRMSGIKGQLPAAGVSREQKGEGLDRTEVETFLGQAETAKTQYAEAHRDPQQALQEYEALIQKAREKLETQEGLLEALASLYRALKRARDTTRSPEGRTALNAVLQKVPARVRTAAQESGSQQSQGQ